MKSLTNIAESILSKDAGIDQAYPEILATLKPLYDTWRNKADHKSKYGAITSLYKVAKPTAVQVAKKMIKSLQDAGTFDYKDFSQYLERSKARQPKSGWDIMTAGNGVVLFSGYKGVPDEISVYYMHNGSQHLYRAKFTDDGIVASCTNHRSAKPVLADANAIHAFEIPGDIAEKIITSSELIKK